VSDQLASLDVISIEKSGEHFRLLYDVKGRFAIHRITPEEACYKLCKGAFVSLVSSPLK
jgi:small subunit ribosomal protein S4e